jgi:8-amino-7-oxononanoate synthase
MFNTPWLICHKSNPQSLIRLFCFPHAGNGATSFVSWHKELPDMVEVITIMPPGRGSRLKETPLTRMKPLVKAITEELFPYLDKPFAFFGYSLGGWIGFEVIRELRRRQDCPIPVHLFIASYPAPQLPQSGTKLYQLPDTEFVERMRRNDGTPKEILSSPKLINLFLPLLRADAELSDTYNYDAEEPLDCPISVFGGTEDREVSQDELKAWCHQTRSYFNLQVFPGNHFFVKENQTDLLIVIARQLEKYFPDRAVVNNSLKSITSSKIEGEIRQSSKDKSSLTSELSKQIALCLKIDSSQLNPDRLIHNLGLDSLQAVEIKNYLEHNFGVVIPMEKFFEDITIEQLATDVIDLMAKPTNFEGGVYLQQPEENTQNISSDRVLESERAKNGISSFPNQTIPFSLLYFSSNEAEFTDDKYQLFIEGAKFADKHDFKAVWIPERHFHAFGGIYPNPSLLGSALAMITKNIRIRAGSVVLPLHDPIRVAEDWSVVDNLSKGRVDLAFAMGWNPNDFVISPNNYINRKEILFSGIKTVQKLWEGKSISLPNGVGEETSIKIYPLPKQSELNVWVTCSGGKERFAEAGSCGANILTALLFQSVEELAEKIAIYRQARARNGYKPETGCVTLMLHTFIGEDINIVRQKVKQPFIEYLKSSVSLWRNNSKNLDELSEKEREDLLSFAFERYFQTSTLFGTPNSCSNLVKRVREIGVNEIACLIDFGVNVTSVMEMLKHLNSLRELVNSNHNSGNSSKAINLQKNTSVSTTDIDLDSRLRLVYKPGKNVLQRAFEFELPDKLRAAGILPYFRELESNEGATCIFDGKQVIMLGSNNYLGLTTDKRVREATARAALEEGPSLTGSRLLNGSTHKHRQFEHKLAAFLGYEDVLVFTTGYQANLGLISALMNEETTLVVDSEAHACIYDGAFMSRCKVVQYQHDDLQDLETKLQEITGKSATMVAIDGVYSMTGEIAPLPEIQILCDRYNATLMVDDAHGLGMLGVNGRGTQEHFNMVGSSNLLCGTFSKSLASIGGWVAAKAKVIDWIRFHGRSMLFSASIPPTSLAAASTALDILISEPNRVKNLNDNARYWRDGLVEIGFNVGQSQTPIVPVIIGDDMKCMVFGKELLEAGVYVNSVVYPAVPRTSALLRTSVMATHHKTHLDKALAIFSRVGKQLALID